MCILRASVLNTFIHFRVISILLYIYCVITYNTHSITLTIFMQHNVTTGSYLGVEKLINYGNAKWYDVVIFYNKHWSSMVASVLLACTHMSRSWSTFSKTHVWRQIHVNIHITLAHPQYVPFCVCYNIFNV